MFVLGNARLVILKIFCQLANPSDDPKERLFNKSFEHCKRKSLGRTDAILIGSMYDIYRTQMTHMLEDLTQQMDANGSFFPPQKDGHMWVLRYIFTYIWLMFMVNIPVPWILWDWIIEVASRDPCEFLFDCSYLLPVSKAMMKKPLLNFKLSMRTWCGESHEIEETQTVSFWLMKNYEIAYDCLFHSVFNMFLSKYRLPGLTAFIQVQNCNHEWWCHAQ